MASSATKTTLPRLLKTVCKPLKSSSSRVITTSSNNARSMTALNLDATAISQCPFRKPIDTFTTILNGDNAMDYDVRPPVVENKQPAAFEQIPGPKGLPIVGTLFDYFKKDGPKFHKMFEVYRQRAQEFGEIYFEKVGAFHSVVVSNPTEYNKVIRAETKFPNRREMEPVAYYRQSKGLDLGLVNSQGEEWYRQRTVVSKKMLKLDEVSAFSGEMGQVSDDFLCRLSDVRDENKEVKGLERELFKWAMESVGTFIFEERIGCLNKEPTPMAQAFIENLEGFFKYLQPLMYNLPIYKLVNTPKWDKFSAYTDNVMEIGQHLVEKKLSAMQSGENTKSAFLSYLLSNDKMTTKEVTGLVVDLLTAAVETVSTATTWALYCLAQNPEVQERLYQEIKNASSESGDISADQLSKLPYVKAVVKETLRLYPIVYSTSRHVANDVEVAGYNVPSGTHIQANLFGMYRDPSMFPDPEAFKPERWLREQKMDTTIKATSNLVWGHGARMCVGRRVAEQEMHILLSKMVQGFQLSYHHDDVEPILNTMMTPDRPVKLCLTPRE